MVSLTLAVGASIAWGASDFLGGLVARRLPVLVVLLGVLLARAWLHEQLEVPRLAGVAAVLGGVALISASAGA
jgi:drug/metabolite transporter (DMT)-like permease